MLKFEDSQNAFQHLSDQQLKNSYLLFKLLSVPFMGRIGPKLGAFAFKWNLPFSGGIAKKLFQQFAGGQSLDESLQTIDNFRARGVGAIIDYSAEGESSEEGFENSVKKVKEAIVFASENREERDLYTVFKCTALCSFEILKKYHSDPALLGKDEIQAFERFEQRVDELCKLAFEKKVLLFIDAEESWIQGPIDAVVERAMAKYNREQAYIFHTVQLYRHDRLLYVNELFKEAKKNAFKLGLKVVRGAYIEKENDYAKSKGIASAIHSSKANTDKDFDACVDFCLTHPDSIQVCVATHNETSIAKAVRKIKKGCQGSVFFSQLLGMGEHITMALAAEHQNVVKLVPYGPLDKVMPYLMRRAEENTSVQGQLGKELELLQQEMQRRNIK